MENKKWTTSILFFPVILLLSGCMSKTAREAGNPMKPGKGNTSFPAFELPLPQEEEGKTYLGISGAGNFKIEQIKARILIIEIFSFYCPHCQVSASQVNELYRKIQDSPDIKEKVKMIGIGAGNSPYEVNAFRERYQVPFPLFPDQSMEISEMLGVKGTPTFIGVKMNDKGAPERFYFEEGFEDAQQFLAKIIKLSGLE